MAREATVTVTLREEDAQWLLATLREEARYLHGKEYTSSVQVRIELKHALAERMLAVTRAAIAKAEGPLVVMERGKAQ